MRTVRAFGVPYLSIRTRFFDDLLLQAAESDGARQIVILAAGMDARAFRLPWPAGTTVYELDRPEVLAAKDEVLAAVGAEPSCRRHALGVDLADPSSLDALLGAGYDPNAPSAWLLKGLLTYLDEGVVRTLLQTVADLVVPGSRLGADLISAPLMQPWLAVLAAQGAPWYFGTDAPEALFAVCGWQATAMQPGEDGADYGRWLLPAPPRELTGMPWVFLVAAQRAPAEQAAPPRAQATLHEPAPAAGRAATFDLPFVTNLTQ